MGVNKDLTNFVKKFKRLKMSGLFSVYNKHEKGCTRILNFMLHEKALNIETLCFSLKSVFNNLYKVKKTCTGTKGHINISFVQKTYCIWPYCLKNTESHANMNVKEFLIQCFVFSK